MERGSADPLFRVCGFSLFVAQGPQALDNGWALRCFTDGYQSSFLRFGPKVIHEGRTCHQHKLRILEAGARLLRQRVSDPISVRRVAVHLDERPLQGRMQACFRLDEP